ncbi:hypothetical protein [Streptococcus mitis]|uniref:hypothetical protein n=1 Tax=Streptococcus mitis TaxID=28037 RepID=UPI00204D323A|nr:hypothetical protein [Streptococcus mitis]DAU63070.1 MAG TPA: hypothetical protein [Caudoviricetes sp.]DAW76009.1 MAG TPA: hypothetical protein [Caudoviricetes sp.]
MIKETLFTSITDTVLAKISKARLNSNQVVSIQKRRDRQFVFVEFLIPDSVREVTKVELLDASDIVLSVIEVYVPIETTTRFKYRLEVLTDG